MLRGSQSLPTVLGETLGGHFGHNTAVGPGFAEHNGRLSGLGWHTLAPENLPRHLHEVFVEPFVREALVRLNPEIAAQPDRAEEVLYELRAILRSARSDGLIKANEAMTEWFRNDKTMPFGENHEHTPVKLFDFQDIENNHFVVTPQYRVQGESGSVTADFVLLVNGLPLVVVEAKPPPRPSVTWYDRAVTIRQEYEKAVPELFVCNVLNVATDGRQLRYGSIGMPENLWGPWRSLDDAIDPEAAATITAANVGMLAPAVLLDILEHFTLFATDDKSRLIKVVCRYQQYQGANLIVDRVADPSAPKKGLIWHFQGSGKSYLMVFAAKKLRQHPKLDNPSVLVVVDRVDLDTQIGNTFHGAKVENLVKAKTRAELKAMLRAGTKKVIITTIFRFGDESAKQEANRLLRWTKTRLRKGKLDEAETFLLDCAELLASLKPNDGKKLRERFATLMASFEKDSGKTLVLPEPKPFMDETDDADDEETQAVPLHAAENVIVLVDEAHRTQEGDLGRKMRSALPNATFFGLTGTPINQQDRNTFKWFGAKCDDGWYLHRYGFEDSVRDGATLPLNFVPRSSELKIDVDSLKEEFAELTGGLSDVDEGEVIRQATRFGVAVKAPQRVAKVVKDIVEDFLTQVRPRGLAAMVVTYDREACLLYKAELDKHLSPAVSDVVFSVGNSSQTDAKYQKYKRDRDAEEKLLDRLREPTDPLKILVVTAKLLTGFDAPIVQTMYLDKPMRDHTLLQAICRTNRTYGDAKTHGLIVDYLGVFDNVAKALEFDEEGFRQVVSNIAKLKDQLPGAIQKCLAYFAGVDRSIGGYEGLIAAQECLPNNKTRDAFAADYSVVSKHWEALSPDPILEDYRTDYKWLSQVYESVKPSTGNGRLLWHALGAKTIELIHENIHVGEIRDDLDELVVDADVLEAIMGSPDPSKKAKEIEIKVAARLRKHLGNPKFKALSTRLEDLKKRFDEGQMHSIAFLKELLDIARDVVAAEKETPPEEDEDRGKAVLTELFAEVATEDTPVVVKRVVDDIDGIVRVVRFPGWQDTSAGEREVKKALRGALFKYRLHSDKELFEKAYGYIVQYY